MELKKKDWWMAVFSGFLLTAGAAFLFYRSFAALLLGVILIPLHLKKRKALYQQQCQTRLLRQFQSAMQVVSGALTAGYSMENAFRNAQEESERLYGREAEICRELKLINRKVQMNESLQECLYAFAYRTGAEDICNFAEIFGYAVRSGGNMTEIIRQTVKKMQEKAEILEEIENAVTAKRTEQKLMNVLFPGILLFVSLSSPEYVSVLYGNLTGAAVMSGCLAGYLFACRWSEKLVDIRV